MNQEVQGLLSPWIRNLRLRCVGSKIEPGTVVLDLACGAGSLSKHIPSSCRYFGVDRIPFKEVGLADMPANCQLLNAELGDPNTPARILDWIGTRPQVITMLAFLEHLKDPAAVIQTYSSLLAPGGRLLGTTPHPIGRRLHDSLARIYLCSRDGADEHESFLGRGDLERVARSAGGSLTGYSRFLFGLNQFFEFRFPG